jgi:GT2 family glycosyltransferase
LPKGYDTPLGEGGARLSGGERQRLCIARAFVKAAPILILDEPTSSIDSQTESVILDALDRLMVGRTTFMIAHRLSTVRHADQILVVDGGQIVEHGTHEELMEQHGLYRSLSEMQSGERRTTKAAPTAPAPAPALEVAATSPDPELAWTGNGLATRPKIVVLGMMTKIPVPGVVWQTMHYLVGLERLGFDAYYVEAHARTPSMFVTAPHEDVSDTAAAFIASTMRRFGLENRWAFHALHDGDRCYGMTHRELKQLYRSAALIINLHGGTRPLEEHATAGTLIYIETDPVTLQVELEQGCEDTIRMLEPHAAFFTFAENLGHPSCELPVTDRFNFRPTRQPVLLDRWAGSDAQRRSNGDHFTTVGNWRQSQREVHFRDDTYSWSKDIEFAKVLALPERTGQTFELALASYTDADQSLLEAHGWLVRPAIELSDDIDHYRDYIEGSRGELTVAKDQNVRLRSGWFSDRSATYLAAGRPVVTQETGFSNVLPTGRGLFAFDTLDEAAAAVEAINADYAGHRVAAREIAQEFFAHDRVLKPILEHVGLSPASRRYGLLPPEVALPDDLVLTPTSKRPLCLEPETVETVLARPHPTPRHRAVAALGPRCAASVIVVTFGDLPLVRMTIESILANTQFTRFEIIVIDNGSAPETVAYLQDVANQFARMRLVLNAHNEGFPAAVNRGLQLATGRVFVVLNDDVIVTPDWLVGLIRHLDDPEVGLVGPVTNAAPNEARVPTTYETYGELVAFAAERRHRLGGQVSEIGVATMFCVAMRRDVFEEVGPLDEEFGIGQFEDDDYAMRVRGAGYRVVCAEDVFVHHFGEASFGRLAPSGEYAEQLDRNRRMFEEKWGMEWTPHERRSTPEYEAVKNGIRHFAREHALPWADVLVVSNGDADLLELDGATAQHFPQGPDGQYTGHHPADGEDAVRQLEARRERGARYVLFPRTTTWWLEHFAALREHLESHATEVGSSDDCRVFELVPSTLDTRSASGVGTRGA